MHGQRDLEMKESAFLINKLLRKFILHNADEISRGSLLSNFFYLNFYVNQSLKLSMA